MAVRFERLVRPFTGVPIAPPRRTFTAKAATASGPARALVGGSPVAGDQLAIGIVSLAIVGSPITLTYDVQLGDTVVNVAAGIVALINADPTLAGAGVTATVAPSRPNEFSINQPPTLDPQATISATVTGGLTIALSTSSVTLTAGDRGEVMVFNISFSLSITVYNKKWPKETTVTETLAGNVPKP